MFSMLKTESQQFPEELDLMAEKTTPEAIEPEEHLRGSQIPLTTAQAGNVLDLGEVIDRSVFSYSEFSSFKLYKTSTNPTSISENMMARS